MKSYFGIRWILFWLIYSAIFPVTNLIGGGVMLIGIILTIPFLPFAWVVGVGFVNLFGSESFYLIGAYFGIFLQVIFLMPLLFLINNNFKK
jgi:hypothetical protein